MPHGAIPGMMWEGPCCVSITSSLQGAISMCLRTPCCMGLRSQKGTKAWDCCWPNLYSCSSWREEGTGGWALIPSPLSVFCQIRGTIVSMRGFSFLLHYEVVAFRHNMIHIRNQDTILVPTMPISHFHSLGLRSCFSKMRSLNPEVFNFSVSNRTLSIYTINTREVSGWIGEPQILSSFGHLPTPKTIRTPREKVWVLRLTAFPACLRAHWWE